MTDEEQQLLKTGAEAAMKPFANLVERLFGGTVDQIGGMWEDRLKVRRQIRQIKLFEKLQRKIREGQFEPVPIPDKVWIPALQAASLEDDDELQEKWAGLLATASEPSSDGVSPVFAKILADLSSSDAAFLDALYDHLLEQATGKKIRHEITANPLGDRGKLFDIYVSTHQYGTEGFVVNVDALLRNRLIEENRVTVDWVETIRQPPEPPQLIYCMTSLGYYFVRCCRGPAPRKSPSTSFDESV